MPREFQSFYLRVLKGEPYVFSANYKGSRFNILFSNASSIFFMHDKMLSFLVSHGAENRLLKSILFDLRTSEYLAGVKALCLISKFITCPLWSVLEDENVSIVDMNTKYLQLVTFLEDLAKNVDNFMSGQMFLFEDHVKKDREYNVLLVARTYDNVVQTYLEVILPALCQLSRRLFQEHLPGGKHTAITPDSAEERVPKSSGFAESVFGQLDRLICTKPSLKSLAAESCIVFLNNKTLKWLHSKDQVEREKLINSSSKNICQEASTWL